MGSDPALARLAGGFRWSALLLIAMVWGFLAAGVLYYYLRISRLHPAEAP